MFNHLLVPTDGSELSNKAIAKAVIFAKECSAKITGFYVKPNFPIFYFGEAAAFDPRALDEFTELANKHADDYLGDLQKLCEEAGVIYSREVSDGNCIYEEIIKVAEKLSCDLIFMASHGRSGLSGLILGSETQKVLAYSKVPVLVYR